MRARVPNAHCVVVPGCGVLLLHRMRREAAELVRKVALNDCLGPLLLRKGTLVRRELEDLGPFGRDEEFRTQCLFLSNLDVANRVSSIEIMWKILSLDQ